MRHQQQEQPKKATIRYGGGGKVEVTTPDAVTGPAVEVK